MVHERRQIVDNCSRADIKKRLGLVILTIIKENREKTKQNKVNGIKDHLLIDSLRKLSASSGVDFSSIQKITTGAKNPSFTTVVAIAVGLNMTLTEVSQRYDSITNETEKKG